MEMKEYHYINEDSMTEFFFLLFTVSELDPQD
jgi:hypothetical protein